MRSGRNGFYGPAKPPDILVAQRSKVNFASHRTRQPGSAPEPGQLPLGELPGPQLHLGNRISASDRRRPDTRTISRYPRACDASRLSGCGSSRSRRTSSTQPAANIASTRRLIRRYSSAGAHRCTRHDPGRNRGVSPSHHSCCCQCADRPAGQVPDLQRPDDPADVVRVQPPCRDRVHRGQPGVQCLTARRVGFGLQSPAQLVVGRRRREQPAQQAPSGRTAFRRRRGPSFPAASMSRDAASARSSHQATFADSHGSSTSIRWCGTRARSAAVGLAVPMSMPRYSVMESTAMISALSAVGQVEGEGRLPGPGRAGQDRGRWRRVKWSRRVWERPGSRRRKGPRPADRLLALEELDHVRHRSA